MLAAASGAYDEEDGKHSQESAAFAFTVMTTMDDLKLGKEVRVHLAEIAGAYTTEIAEGADIGDANMTEDSALKPSTSAFGMKSVFTLSPKDTYRFLKLFADSAENLAPFDEGMGRFSQKLIADASATTRRTGDVERLDKVFTALGNVRGFELAAVTKVQGNLDMIDKQRDDLVGFIRDTAIGATSMVLAPTTSATIAWFALSTSLSAKAEVRARVAILEAALDPAHGQFTGQSVWVGPTARRFAEDLTARRVRLRQAAKALVDALEEELRSVPAKVPPSAVRP
ncbi:hypothetical protein ACFV1N_00665 [Streptosporangium canum]|uniref:hypothetical protein n=1 Tax=Streptosporangium canum TaxID=324952 RepID=UPI00368E253A